MSDPKSMRVLYTPSELREASLFTPQHQLNYDEALRRIEYWLVQPGSGWTVKLIVQTMRRNRDNLYFEPKE